MTPHKTGFFPVFLVSSLALLFLGGCRTWSSREERAAQAYNDGNSYRISGRNNEALESYRLALKYEPQMAAAVYNQALILAEMDRMDEAFSLLQSLNQRDPQNLKVLRALAWISWMDGRVQASLDYYYSVLIISPGDMTALRSACEVLEASGRAGEAVAMRKLLFRLDGSIETQMDLGKAQLSAEYHRDALETFRAVLAENPENSEALSAAAQSAENLGYYNESVAYLLEEAMLEEDAGDLLWRAAGIQLVKLGEYETGLRTLKEALEEGFSDSEAFRELIESVPASVRVSVRNLLSDSL